MNITYTNTITADEVNSIRASVGLRQINPEQVKAGLDGSTVILVAYDRDKAFGMTSLIWDGGTVALIPNILVLPEYQMQGIETEMITRIFDFLRAKLKPGFGRQVDIEAWNNTEHFYDSLGFQVSTPQLRGVPMHICLTNQIEMTDSMFWQIQFSSKETTK